MTAKEYLESQISIDCQGFSFNDPKLLSALCEYAIRINKKEGYTLSSLENLLNKYFNNEDAKKCYNFVSNIIFYTTHKLHCPIDD